jgi:hypothetical protein
MPACPKIISLPHDVAVRLLEIGGLTQDVLREAALLGEQARENCPVSFPVTAPGMLAYFARVGSLRDQLCAYGWEQKCEGGSELVVSPDKAHAIVVASGDVNTGSLTDTPKTKCPKGTRMDEAASRNEMQMSFFDLLGVEDISVVRQVQEPGRLTWVLLVARTDKGLAVELSLVGGLGVDGRGEVWLERIVLPITPLDEGLGMSMPPRMPEPGPEFEVSVTRKAVS